MVRKRVAQVVLSFLAGSASVYFLYPVVEYEWQRWKWHSAFEEQLDQKASVPLGDLVSFNWDAVFILYSLSLEEKWIKDRVWNGKEFHHRWEHNDNYYVVVYRRTDGREPFAAELKIRDWRFARAVTDEQRSDASLVFSRSQNARIELLNSDSVICPGPKPPTDHAKCLRLVDEAHPGNKALVQAPERR